MMAPITFTNSKRIAKLSESEVELLRTDVTEVESHLLHCSDNFEENSAIASWPTNSHIMSPLMENTPHMLSPSLFVFITICGKGFLFQTLNPELLIQTLNPKVLNKLRDNDIIPARTLTDESRKAIKRVIYLQAFVFCIEEQAIVEPRVICRILIHPLLYRSCGPRTVATVLLDQSRNFGHIIGGGRIETRRTGRADAGTTFLQHVTNNGQFGQRGKHDKYGEQHPKVYRFYVTDGRLIFQNGAELECHGQKGTYTQRGAGAYLPEIKYPFWISFFETRVKSKLI
uniref:Uncharacterized protein n=1 Tax=Romanomermis culicivorax TaxID=13658 RepID=A0A915IJV4_ROMCU